MFEGGCLVSRFWHRDEKADPRCDARNGKGPQAMDPLSITTACVSLVCSVTKVSMQISDFVRKAREARGDLDAVSRELVSLKTVLEILSDDAGTGKGFPNSLAKQISGILTNCGGVLEQIETSLQKHAGGGITPAVKWTLSGRDDMDKLRSNLEAHKSALDIALDMVSLCVNPWLCYAIAELKFTAPLLVKSEQIPRRFETIHRQSRKTLRIFSLKLRATGKITRERATW